MVTSMTGLGVGESKWNDRTITVEIRAVNNRFLELSTRLPIGLSAYEQIFKEIIRKEIHRGKLYVNVNVQGEQNGCSKLKISPEAIVKIRGLLESLKEEAGIEEPLRLDHFLQYSEIFEPTVQTDETEMLWEHVKIALKQALENLKAMRILEGACLLEDIRLRLKSLVESVRKIQMLAESNVKDSHQKMLDRVQKLISENALDQDRLYTEITIMADKLDITEECVRLESHHRLFREILDDDGVVGKKLNFLLQEMNREVNTISSKANNTDISHLVVSMKEEIEKLREQVQNLE